MYGLQETLSNIDRLKAQVEKATQAGKSTPITMESLEMVEKWLEIYTEIILKVKLQYKKL